MIFASYQQGKDQVMKKEKQQHFIFYTYNRRESGDYILEQLLRDIDFNQAANTKMYCN